MAPCTNINLWLIVATSLCIIALAILLVIMIWTDYQKGREKLDTDIEEIKTKAALEQDKVVHIHIWREEQAAKPKGLVKYDEQQPA